MRPFSVESTRTAQHSRFAASGRPRAHSERAPAGAGPPLPIELAALEPYIDPALFEAAARRAALLQIGGDEVARAHGLLSPDEITEALAEHLGLEIDPLDDDAPPDSERILEAARTGVLRRIDSDGRARITVAPRGSGIARLAAALERDPRLVEGLRLASPERLSAYVRRIGATELAREAVLGLHSRCPDLSAAERGSRSLRVFAGLIAAAALVLGLISPAWLLLAMEGFLGTAFLAWIGLRLRACFVRPDEIEPLRVPERALPVYTIVVPLYREARIVPRLVAALRRLDYPLEKLDIKLVVEADDPDTRYAIARLRLGAPFEEIVAPRAGPRTKPKALAAALPFARGSFLVVYDAEDEPDSDQLRKALAAFRGAPQSLACMQARLTIDNASDNWITRHYAAEYAALFDVFLPSLAHMRLPIPLGGTSNHFRTEVLRRVGGWDPFNVTEDTDIGIRLVRFGYRIGTIDSATYEEAPAKFMPWLRQRTRWFKGWVQTFLVHMRAPRRLLRELGLRGFLAFQLLVGGTVLAALVHPFFLGLVFYDAGTGVFSVPSEMTPEGLRRGLALTVLAAGYAGSALIGLIGLKRRQLLRLAPVLVTIPFYWLLLSLAAWRALFQFLLAPYKWEKTEHGLARTSRRQKQNRPARPVRAAASGRLRPAPRSA